MRSIAKDAGRSAPALRALRHGEHYSVELARGAMTDLEGPPGEWVKGRFPAGIDANLRLLEALEAGLSAEPDAPMPS